MKCGCCGSELVWMGSIRDGRMGCVQCPKFDPAASVGGNTRLTYIVPDEFWGDEYVERLRQLGWNVVKHSEFWGKYDQRQESQATGWVPNKTLVDEEFYGD